MPQSVVMRIQVDADAKRAIDAICERRGMTQIAIMSRLIGWFLGQDSIVQTCVMEALSADATRELAKRRLNELKQGV